jgi:hypothetical protein
MIRSQFLSRRLWAAPAVMLFGISVCAGSWPILPATAADAARQQSASTDRAATAKLWADRGALTPAHIYWGPGSTHKDRLSRLPAPPFSSFKKDTTVDARTPKGKVVDKNGVNWTFKLGEESRSDVVTPRLAWAFGYCAIESYYVPVARIEGITRGTDLGRVKGWILKDGRLKEGARFKRRDDRELQNAEGKDITWELKKNPGVPDAEIDGLRLFNVLVNNWDVGPKNCKILRIEGSSGPEDWYYISDLGASLAGGRWSKYDLGKFQRDSLFVKGIDKDHMLLDFRSANTATGQQSVHQRIPLAHVRWFVERYEKLPRGALRAAFDAAYATEALNQAYAAGDPAEIEKVREREIPAHHRAEIDGFVSKLHSRIEELKRNLGSTS